MRSRTLEIIGLLLVATLPLFSIPLSWLPQQVAHYRFIVTLPIAAVMLVGLLLATACWTLRSESPAAPAHGAIAGFPRSSSEIGISAAILWPSVLLLLSWLISTCFSQHPRISIGLLPMLLSNFAVFLLVTRFPVDARRKLVWVWLFIAALVAINEIARLRSETEVISTIGNRNFLGAYLAASIALGVSLWDKRATVICVLLLTAMYFCQSRGAWLALGVTAVLWLFLGNWRKPKARAACRIVGVTLVVAAVVFGCGYAMRKWQTEVRPLIWESTLHMIAERPFLGHGLGTFVTEYPRFRLPEYFLRSLATNVTDHAHNELLEITAEQGLLGLAATLWLWGIVFYRGVRSLRAPNDQQRLSLGILGGITVLLLHGMLDVGLQYPPNQTLFWFLLGLMVCGNGLPEDTRARSGVPSTDMDIVARLRSRFMRAIIVAICVLGSVWITIAGVARPVMAEFWERKARMAEERRDMVEAETGARRSLEFQPFRSTVRYMLAGMLDKHGERDQAIEQCLLIEELSPDYADVTYNLGQLYMAQGRFQEALPYLRRATEINPYSANRQIALASVYAQLGRLDLARAHLENALHLDPKNTAARDLLAKLAEQPTR
jgi:O-antigen ligase